jgi:isoleucyl-tRNA synthetase
MNDKEILNLLKTEFRRKFQLSSRKSETLAGWDAEKSGEQNQPARKSDPLFVLHDGPDQ